MSSLHATVDALWDCAWGLVGIGVVVGIFVHSYVAFGWELFSATLAMACMMFLCIVLPGSGLYDSKDLCCLIKALTMLLNLIAFASQVYIWCFTVVIIDLFVLAGLNIA